MKFLLLTSVALAVLCVASAHLRPGQGKGGKVVKKPVPAPTLPDVLLNRAREVIERAQKQVQEKRVGVQSRLIKALKTEIVKVQFLELALSGAVLSKRVELNLLHQIEERLLSHQNLLIELGVKFQNNDKIIVVPPKDKRPNGGRPQDKKPNEVGPQGKRPNGGRPQDKKPNEVGPQGKRPNGGRPQNKRPSIPVPNGNKVNKNNGQDELIDHV